MLDKEAELRSRLAILGATDAIMHEMGLMCITYSTVPAIYNSEIYSITATFEAVIDRDGVIYGG